MVVIVDGGRPGQCFQSKSWLETKRKTSFRPLVATNATIKRTPCPEARGYNSAIPAHASRPNSVGTFVRRHPLDFRQLLKLPFHSSPVFNAMLRRPGALPPLPAKPGAPAHKFSAKARDVHLETPTTTRHVVSSRATLLPHPKPGLPRSSQRCYFFRSLFLRWENYLRAAHSPHQNSQGSTNCYDRNTRNAQVR
jgi:hypothetical protein